MHKAWESRRDIEIHSKDSQRVCRSFPNTGILMGKRFCKIWNSLWPNLQECMDNIPSDSSVIFFQRLDQRGDLARPGGRLHAGRRAHEQVVGKEAPQTRQGMAHRRLRQPDPAGGAGHGSLGHQGVERL